MLFFFSFFLAKKTLYFFDWRNDWPSDNVPSSIWDGWIFFRLPYIHRLRKLIRHFARLFVRLFIKTQFNQLSAFSFVLQCHNRKPSNCSSNIQTDFLFKKKFFFQGNAILNHTHTILDVDGPCVDSATTNEKKEPLESKQMFPDRNLRPNRVKRVLERFW